MKKILKTVICLFIPLGVFGQLTPVTNQYILNPMTINPAFAGNRGALNMAAFFRKQWVGVSGAPETTTISADAPLFDNKIGLGLMIVNDKVGVSHETQFVTDYSYKVTVGKGILSFGLGAGLTATNTAWSDLVVLDPGDELYLVDSRLFVIPNLRFGTYYTFGNQFAGFSIPRFVSSTFKSASNKYGMDFDPGKYDYMLTYGGTIELNRKLNFMPSTMISYTPGGKLLYDLNAYFNYSEKFWVGASYRSNRSVTGLFQFQINNQLKVAYSYDFDFGKIGTYSNGSHEIMLRYEFRYKVNVASPLYF